MAAKKNSAGYLVALAIGGYLLYRKIKPGIVFTKKLVDVSKVLMIHLDNVDFHPGTVNAVKLNFTFTNISDAALQVRGISGYVFVNGTNYGRFVNTNLQIVKANGTSQLTVLLKLNMVNVIREFATVLTNKQNNLTVIVQGEVNVNGRLLPLKINWNG